MEAVDRVYAGGTAIRVAGEEVVIEPIPGPEHDHTRVSAMQRRWMLDAVELMQELRPGWTIVRELREDGRRWPWLIQLEHADGSMWVQVWSECITFRHMGRSVSDDDQEWAFWWRTIRRFASLPAAIFHPDTYELVATSMSAAAARGRYEWL